MNLRKLYWYYVKYRPYTKKQREFLCTFEAGIRARKEVDSIVYTLLRLNIKRAKCMFHNDFEQLKTVDEVIGTMGKEYESDAKRMDSYDAFVWKKIFIYFLANHDNETTSKVWGAPIGEVVKIRAQIEKSKTNGK